jgi:CheY-like chemotaxis protein
MRCCERSPVRVRACLIVQMDGALRREATLNLDAARILRPLVRRLSMLLIVEDDPAVLHTLRRLTGDRPTVSAASAVEARELLETRPDITGGLIDVALPEGPRAGLDVLAWIREKRGFIIPCALVTGNSEEAVLDAAVIHRATVVRKPAVGPRLEWGLERFDRSTPEKTAQALLRGATARYGLTPRGRDRRLVPQRPRSELVPRRAADLAQHVQGASQEHPREDQRREPREARVTAPLRRARAAVLSATRRKRASTHWMLASSRLDGSRR